MKKTRTGISIILIILFSLVCFKTLNNWLNEGTVPSIPQRSTKNKVVLASEGCCFWAENVIVYLLDNDGNKTMLIEEDRVNEYDIYECNDVMKIEAPVQIGMDFVGYYPDAEAASLIVGEFPNTSELLKHGLLLCFGDGDLTVRNGNDEKRFRDGSFGGDDDGPWYQER